MAGFARAMLLGFAAILLTASIPMPTEAQMGGFSRKGGGAEADTPSAPSDTVEKREHAITETGLKADFPVGFECESVASPFGSPYCYDGSKRRSDATADCTAVWILPYSKARRSLLWHPAR